MAQTSTTDDPAREVVWLLARPAPSDGERRDAASRLQRALESGASPTLLVSALAGHGLVPLAYRHLLASPGAPVPDALADELGAEFRRHAVSRFRFTQLLKAALDAIEAAGVAVVPFKGPTLAVQLHGNYAMRQYGDLDLLVHPADVAVAREALVRAGLVAAPAPIDSRWAQYLRCTRHSEALTGHDGTLIELHWSVADRFHGVDLRTSWLFEQTSTVDLVGRPTRAMSAERLLLALCLHGARHLWERAAWLSEIAALIVRTPDLDWPVAYAEADRIDLGRSLRACLRLCRDLLAVAPPDPWLAALDRDAGARRLADALRMRVASPAARQDRLHDRFRLGLLARRTWPRRVQFCWRVATELSERDMASLRQPPRIPALHALTRTLRLARRARADRRAAG